MQFTDEQEAILESDAPRLRAKAYAGCTKTSTQVEYARRRPNKRFLYIAYNASVREEAQERFPPNVQCVTSHGLAHRAFGRPYQHKLGNPKPLDLTRTFGWDYQSASAVLNTVTAFMHSADAEIGEVHAIAAGVRPERTGAAVDAAARVWESMTDRGQNSLRLPHDGYLKLYQLTSPKLTSIDGMLCDEWQDANPVVVDIVQRQKCGKFYVGDPYQAIYAWRGAVNALDVCDVDAEFRLTTSFRFGSGVADLASRLLHDWCSEEVPLRGAGPLETVWTVDRSAPYTLLARTNCGLFDGAVAALANPNGFGFTGGIKGYKFDLILDGYRLYTGKLNEVRDPTLQQLGDWAQLKLYADEVDDKEFKALIRVVEDYKGSIPQYVSQIVAAARDDGPVGITLSTAHKAKGLEFDSVVLLDDFRPLEMRRDHTTGIVAGPDAQEVNLIYMALTRSLRCLEVNAGVRDWLSQAGHTDLLSQFGIPAAADLRQAVLPIDPVPAPSAPSLAVAPAVQNGRAGILGWVHGNPEKSGPWLRRVSASIAAGSDVGTVDRMMLARLLEDMAANRSAVDSGH